MVDCLRAWTGPAYWTQLYPWSLDRGGMPGLQPTALRQVQVSLRNGQCFCFASAGYLRDVVSIRLSALAALAIQVPVCIGCAGEYVCASSALADLL